MNRRTTICFAVCVYMLSIFVFVSITGCSNMISDYRGDTTAPSGTFYINSDDLFTYSLAVTLNMEFTDALEMRFSNNGTDWSDWEHYDFSKSWTLTGGHGGKRVYGQFRDAAGNIGHYNDIITPLIEEKITASDGASNDYFSGYEYTVHGSGVSVSSDGTTIVVGSWMDDSQRGSVYVYKWDGSGWNETKISASDGESGDRFGFSVSVSADGDSFVVGSWFDNTTNGTYSGSVYIYEWDGSGWNETNITASDGKDNDNFGLSVSMSADGNMFAAGAYHHDLSANPNDNHGATYVYRRNGSNWIETKLTASDTAVGDLFGFHVSVSSDGDTVVVGAVGDDSSKGSGYVYKWSGSNWAEKKITASDGVAGDFFGRIVSISSDGNIVGVGAYRDDVDIQTDQGSVYVYRWNGIVWNETRIYASDGNAEDCFGYSLSLSGDGNRLLVGALHDHIDTIADQGLAYLFCWDGTIWNETKLVASDGAVNDSFGYSVSVSSDGHTLAVGAPGRDVGVNANQGALYIY